jgi:transcriptional regulator with PAS, ATPase and Fis domain
LPITGEPAGKVGAPAAAWCHDEVLRLPGSLEHESTTPSNGSSSRVPLADQVRELKVRLIRRALAESGGNQRVAAEALGLHRQSLTRMLRDLASGIARAARARRECAG